MSTVTIKVGRTGKSGKKTETGSYEMETFGQAGAWAITREFTSVKAFVSLGNLYAVTHVPTGYAFASDLTLERAREALEAVSQMPGDWAGLTDPTKMTLEMKRAGGALRRRFEP